MIRTQIQLTDQQMARVRQAARAHGVSIAEMIRWLVNRGGDGADDVAARHDDYQAFAFDSHFGDEGFLLLG